ncbi:hypothetical protein R9X47_00045 [Wukongibacter baidiensis]|uniref:hypothetical protein n=1 Tax=Wukongibacter baidiensis TaxID=1723361 RepID=UPI003D7FC5B7
MKRNLFSSLYDGTMNWNNFKENELIIGKDILECREEFIKKINSSEPFIILYGQSGHGKSTFLRWIKEDIEFNNENRMENFIVDIGNGANNFEKSAIEPLNIVIKNWLSDMNRTICDWSAKKNCKRCEHKNSCEVNQCIGLDLLADFFINQGDFMKNKCTDDVNNRNENVIDRIDELIDLSFELNNIKSFDSAKYKKYKGYSNKYLKLIKYYLNDEERLKLFILYFINYCEKHEEKKIIIHFDNLDVIRYELFKSAFLEYFNRIYLEVSNPAKELNCPIDSIKFVLVVRNTLHDALENLELNPHRLQREKFATMQFRNYNHFEIFENRLSNNLKKYNDDDKEYVRDFFQMIKGKLSVHHKFINIFNRDIRWIEDFWSSFTNCYNKDDIEKICKYNKKYEHFRRSVNSILYHHILEYLYNQNRDNSNHDSSYSPLLNDLIDSYFAVKPNCNIYRMLLIYLFNRSSDLINYDHAEFESKVNIREVHNDFIDLYGKDELISAIKNLVLGNRYEINTYYWNNIVGISNCLIHDKDDLKYEKNDLIREGVTLSLQPAGFILIRHIFLNFEFFTFIINKQDKSKKYKPLYMYLNDFWQGLELIEKVLEKVEIVFKNIDKFYNEKFSKNISSNQSYNDKQEFHREFLNGNFSYKRKKKTEEDQDLLDSQGVFYAVRIVDNHLYHIDRYRIMVTEEARRKYKLNDANQQLIYKFNEGVINVIKKYLVYYEKFQTDKNKFAKSANNLIKVIENQPKINFDFNVLEKEIWRE